MLIEAAIQRIPDRQFLIVFRHFDLIADGTDNNVDGLIVNVLNVISCVDGAYGVPRINIANVRTGAVLVDSAQHITDLVIGDDNLAVLWVDTTQRIANGR